MRETTVAKRARARRILQALERAYPDAKIALELQQPVRAAGGDDPLGPVHRRAGEHGHARIVPPVPDRARPGAGRARQRLEGEIRSTGFFRAKTRSLLGMAQAVVERHGGEVPQRARRPDRAARRGAEDRQRGDRQRVRRRRPRGRHPRLPGVAAPGPGPLRRSRRDPRPARRHAAPRPADPGDPSRDHPRPSHLPRPHAGLPGLSRADAVPVARQDQAEVKARRSRRS